MGIWEAWREAKGGMIAEGRRSVCVCRLPWLFACLHHPENIKKKEIKNKSPSASWGSVMKSNHVVCRPCISSEWKVERGRGMMRDRRCSKNANETNDELAG
jgi:hypothetical protein